MHKYATEIISRCLTWEPFQFSFSWFQLSGIPLVRPHPLRIEVTVIADDLTEVGADSTQLSTFSSYRKPWGVYHPPVGSQPRSYNMYYSSLFLLNWGYSCSHTLFHKYSVHSLTRYNESFVGIVVSTPDQSIWRGFTFHESE